METVGNSFFHFKQFSILHQEKGLKVTTDACLLGAYAHHKKPKRCLDIGTGTSVIALFLAQKFKSTSIDAIEIDKHVHKQAVLNINSSPFNDRIECIHTDFLSYKSEFQYDLITCNPPYFSNSLQKKDSAKNNAIHNNHLELNSFLSNCEDNLHNDGKLWLIYPPYEADVCIDIADQCGLILQDKTVVYNKPNKHFRTILCFALNPPETLSSESLTMFDISGNKTKEFQLLLDPFYLEDTKMFKNK